MEERGYKNLCVKCKKQFYAWFQGNGMSCKECSEKKEELDPISFFRKLHPLQIACGASFLSMKFFSGIFFILMCVSVLDYAALHVYAWVALGVTIFFLLSTFALGIYWFIKVAREK